MKHRHHAFVIEAEEKEGIRVARAWVEKELGMKGENNPDIVVLRYGFLPVEEARTVADSVAGAPFAGDTKAVIIAASRVYHEAQNALLKLFEEPPRGAYLFLILPSLGGLLPTLRSRVQEIFLSIDDRPKIRISKAAEEFIKANKEKRSALIKQLSSGKDEEERRELRDEVLALVNGIEAVAYEKLKKSPSTLLRALLSDIATLRGYLHDRSAPVKLILEHLSFVLPKNLI